MNEKDLFTNIRTRLINQNWTGSSTVVFPSNSVRVTASLPEGFVAALNSGVRPPICLIAPAGADSDPQFDEEPDFIRFRIAVLIAVVLPGGHVGQEPIMGANRASTTTSEGAGLLDIEPEFYNAVGKLNALESITLQVRQRGEEGAVFREPGTIIAYRTYQLEAWGTAA